MTMLALQTVQTSQSFRFPPLFLWHKTKKNAESELQELQLFADG